MDILDNPGLHRSEYWRSGTILIIKFSWGPFGFYTEIYGWIHWKIQRGDPMKMWQSKLSQIFNTHCGEPLGYPECPCKVLEKIIIGKVKIRRTRTIWRQDEQALLYWLKNLSRAVKNLNHVNIWGELIGRVQKATVLCFFRIGGPPLNEVGSHRGHQWNFFTKTSFCSASFLFFFLTACARSLLVEVPHNFWQVIDIKKVYVIQDEVQKEKSTKIE